MQICMTFFDAHVDVDKTFSGDLKVVSLTLNYANQGQNGTREKTRKTLLPQTKGGNEFKNKMMELSSKEVLDTLLWEAFSRRKHKR